MAHQKYGKLIIYALLIVVLLFGLIRILITGGPNFLRLELAGMAFLLLLSFMGFIQHHTKWGEPLFGLVFLLYIINLILIRVYSKSLYVILLILAIAGFYLVLFSIHKKSLQSAVKKSPSPINTEIHSVKEREARNKRNLKAHNTIFDNLSSTMKVAQETSRDNVDTSFIPEKFVASKQSNQFHEPKCDWAKKIRTERRIWFASKQEAWEKGYRSHSCMQS